MCVCWRGGRGRASRSGGRRHGRLWRRGAMRRTDFVSGDVKWEMVKELTAAMTAASSFRLFSLQ